MIVVLEGLEGVGKTTLSQLLAARLAAVYLKTPTVEYNAARGVVAANQSKYTRFYFYLSSLFLLQEQLQPYKSNPSKHVIVDRYIHSTIAYHDSGANFTAPPFAEADIMDPDLTILITCEEEERQRRLRDRGFHLFLREQANESAIENYFRAISDIEFANVGSLTARTESLADQVSTWFAENVNALRK